MKFDFKFYAITDRKKNSENDFFRRIENACAAGLRVIQVREKDLSTYALCRLCDRIRSITSRYGAKALINDRADIALQLDLDGIHLTEKSLPADEARKIIGQDKLIGVSTHSLEGLRKAQAASADFAVLGPVASTSSKPPGHPVLTSEEFSAACESVSLPVFALGGIQPYAIQFWLDHGAYGIAGISIWMEAPDVSLRLKQLEKSLGHL